MKNGWIGQRIPGSKLISFDVGTESTSSSILVSLEFGFCIRCSAVQVLSTFGRLAIDVRVGVSDATEPMIPVYLTGATRFLEGREGVVG